MHMKIVDIIEYEGDNTTFVWKHPSMDFNTLSQLIVHESQEALLFSDGQALDLFGAGRHTLHTQNIPLLRKIVNIPTDGKSPFHCEVYFINKTEQMAIKWGVGGIDFLDSQNNNYRFILGANGEMSLRIVDSRKLVVKLVGTETFFAHSTFEKYFKSVITMHIKSMLPTLLIEKGMSVFQVESDLPGLSEALRERISKELEDYGISLEKFWINAINKPENDRVYIELNELRGRQVTQITRGELDIQQANIDKQIDLTRYTGVIQKSMMDIDVEKYAQQTLGYTYQQKEGFDVMKRIADNEGSGSDLRNAAMGIGMGYGVGGAFGHAINDISRGTMFSGLMNSMGQPMGENKNSMEQPSNGGFGADSIPGMINLKEEQNSFEFEKKEGQSAEQLKHDLTWFQEEVEKLKLMKDILPEEVYQRKIKELMDMIG